MVNLTTQVTSTFGIAITLERGSGHLAHASSMPRMYLPTIVCGPVSPTCVLWPPLFKTASRGTVKTSTADVYTTCLEQDVIRTSTQCFQERSTTSTATPT